MKVALLLTGLARKVEEGFNTTWKNVIESYDTDVYLHTWKDEEWEKVSHFYPLSKSIQIQEPFKFTKYKEGIKLPHTDKSRPIPQYDVMSCFRQLPMFYSWQMGYKPLYDSMIDYDVVIRSRYDLGIRNAINLQHLNLELVNHSNINGGFFDDNLCITNKQNADIIFYSVFDDVVKNARETGVLNSAESTWTTTLERYNMLEKSTRHSSLYFHLLRDNKVWWGDENGNII